MQSVTKLRLFASPGERQMLFATMERYNAACNAASPVAFSERQFSDRGLQARLYRHIRESFGLSAQMTILALRKVAGSYRSTREAIKEQNKVLAALGKPLKVLTELSFQEHGAICYDWPGALPRPKPGERLDTGRPAQTPVYPTSVFPGGRDRQADGSRLPGRRLLALRDRGDPGRRAADPPEYLGVVNIATTSDGATFSSDATEKVRQRYGRLRGFLQKTGTKSAKRRLQKISGREHRFKTDTNHVISKKIVCAAQDTKRGIALEDLTGILLRTHGYEASARATPQVGVPSTPILHRVQGSQGRSPGEDDRRGVRASSAVAAGSSTPTTARPRRRSAAGSAGIPRTPI